METNIQFQIWNKAANRPATPTEIRFLYKETDQQIFSAWEMSPEEGEHGLVTVCIEDSSSAVYELIELKPKTDGQRDE